MDPVSAAPAFCTACGQRLNEGSRFCIHCGAALNQGLAAPGPQGSTPVSPFACAECGGYGSRLPPSQIYCPLCRWLRPLCPDYAMDAGVFTWRFDAEAMNTLQSIAPLRAAAHATSERFGRPWFEAALNGVRLSERQLPHVFRAAIYAARVVGLSYLPEIYISGEEMWNGKTLGSDSGAFVALGSVLLNFKGDDLLFILGREMGHARAGHALWRTVTEFVAGRRAQRNIMGEGILQFLNPAKIVESAIDVPLMAWARHSEITADRAGLLVVGKEEVARRVLLQWTLKSFPIYAQLDQDAWREQEEQSEEQTVRMSEWLMSSTPYIAPRLKLLREFTQTEEFRGWRAFIDYWSQQSPPPEPVAAVPSSARPTSSQQADSTTVRLVCAACREPMRVKRSVLQGAETVKVRCPNPKCRKVLEVKPKEPEPPGPDLLDVQD
ncbi:MAG: M48 family metalloprotease [Candidatus Tectomicrobia bacterium]|uniref:M48 family metalloprotease n=1 Tax=Tectimicrobiota bacterium TaxID=2528274 RepID=A0A932CND8_UNCTE|nr:M48 family metalloprotease [Candidatus Tectomicrobia bacterium]